MTNPEFSDTFDTLLNSYNIQAQFGEQSSKADIVLDEYEKSVLLTQAQEIIVKSYFDARLNSEGAGIDDNTKRQVDFSSLIKVKELKKCESQESRYDEQGILYQMPMIGNTEVPDVLFILNEKLLYKHYKKGDLTWTEDMPGKVRKTEVIGQVQNRSQYQIKVYLTLRLTDILSERTGTWYTKSVDEETKTITVNVMHVIVTGEEDIESTTITLDASEELFDIDFEVTLPWNTQTVLSEFSNVLIGGADALDSPYKKEYVIVPLNYKEYDRMHSRAYSQPLKKQAWRLFQNQSTGFDTQTELIPKFSVKEMDTSTDNAEFIYKIRYVKRPTPIVLEDLPDGLTIGGEDQETPCKLHPALHMEILNKAVELALATRGRIQAKAQEQ